MQSAVRPGYQTIRKGRCSEPNRIYLLTTVTHERIPWFSVFEFGHCMCRSLVARPGLGDAELLCWVVMPDHVHLMLQINQAPLHRVMNRLKSRSAVLLNRQIGRAGRFWEEGFHDRALRREEDLLIVARYIVANPLRAGLVKRVREYPFWNAVWL